MREQLSRALSAMYQESGINRLRCTEARRKRNSEGVVVQAFVAHEVLYCRVCIGEISYRVGDDPAHSSVFTPRAGSPYKLERIFGLSLEGMVCALGKKLHLSHDERDFARREARELEFGPIKTRKSFQLLS